MDFHDNTKEFASQRFKFGLWTIKDIVRKVKDVSFYKQGSNNNE